MPGGNLGERSAAAEDRSRHRTQDGKFSHEDFPLVFIARGNLALGMRS
jgi:hypothetical protein